MRRHCSVLPLLTVLALATAASAAVAQAPATRADSSAKKPLPLAVGRTATVTTSRGTWISVDVSPDGQSLVFDLLGQLYTMPITGGRPTALTSGLAFNAQPRFSPDGKRVVFVSDRSGGDNLWLMTLDLKDTVQLTKGNNNLYLSPTFTPDGKYVVASRSGGPLGGSAKLWMFHVDGGSGIQLIREPPTLKTVGAAVTPDGRSIWYAQRTGDWQYNAIFPQYQLAIYDREKGTSTTVTSRYGSAFRPALSPDGKWLVYGTRHDAATGLRTRDLTTGAERWLAYPVQRDEQESRAPLDVLPGYAFTPDSRAIVVSYGGELWRVPVDGTAPAKIPFTVDAQVVLGPEVKFHYKVDDAPTFVARQIRDAVPSPDGTRLAFSALDRLWVMDWPAGTPRRVTTNDEGEFYPSWSPDGKSLAFVTWQDATGGHVMKARADATGTPQQLTTAAAFYAQTAWSPDGKRIVTIRSSARELQEARGFFGGPQLAHFVWVPATGGDATVIAPTQGRTDPHFASDSGRIYAYSPRDGLVSFRWDGTDEKFHLKVTGPLPPSPDAAGEPGSVDVPVVLDQLEPNPVPPPAAQVRMAPQGDRALARIGMDLYVVTVPLAGATAPTVSLADTASATVPVRRLTDIGGEFATWSTDGKRVHWSLGNAHMVYDLDRAKQVDDSLKAARRTSADSARRAGTDSTVPRPDPAALARTDSLRKAAMYKPDERRVEVRATRDLPTGTVVLRGARVVTMKGLEIIDDADVVVKGNRLAAIGKRGAAGAPADAQVIDVTGTTIVPGFVDTHYHTQWLVPAVHWAQTWQYLATLAYGVTTTRDPQTSTTDILTYADRVDMGASLGPRSYSTGPGVFASEQIKDLDQARNILKRYAQYYDTRTLKMYMTGNRQQRQWVIMAAKELGLMPTTEGGLDFKLDLTHAIDGYPGIEHALPVTPIFEDVVGLFKESQVTNTPTLLVSYGGPFGENYWYTNTEVHDDAKLAHFTPEPELDAKTRRRGNNPGPGGWFRKDEYVFTKHAEFARDVVKAGGRIGIGSHGQLQGLGYHWELWSMSTGGLDNHSVLALATRYGAEAIGLADDIGTLEPGKLADLVVLDRDPLIDLANTTSIRYVMKNGRLYEGETLNEVWPRKRALPPQPWMRTGPVGLNAGIR